jgi:phosphoglycolate phosphatase-like HAD superfamily hydrolase
VTAVAVDLDRTLCDTRALWLDWLRSAAPVLGIDPDELPEDRAEAGAELDRRGAGNWRALLARWSEERAPVYIRREAGTSEALRALEAAGYAIGVFTDAPESLARVALAHLGADRRIAALETGAAARERLLERLGDGSVVVESRGALLDLAAAA